MKAFEESAPLPLLLLCFQFHDLEHHDGDLDSQYSLGHKAGNVLFQLILA